jgi:nitrogen regulatory protein P-II 1
MESELVEIRAVVRPEMLDRVVRCLKESGVPRLTVTRVHAIGAGVDPAAEKFSLVEGSAYADKAMVQFICDCACWASFVDLIADTARTGRRGDGIVSVHPVQAVRKIRTNLEGIAALQ